MNRFAVVGLATLGTAYVIAGSGVSTKTAQQAAPVPSSSATTSVSAPKRPGPPTNIGQPTNVVILLIDDLPVSEAAFMPGNSVRHYTPNLDALASQSLVLSNFHTITPICTPSRYSLLTGNYPSKSKGAYQTYRLNLEGSAVPEFTSYITSADRTLPQRLQSMGFRTGFTGKDHVVEHKDYWLNYTYTSTATLADANINIKLRQDEATAIKGLKNIGFDEVYSVFPTNPLELPVKELQAHNLDWIVDGAKKFIDGNYNKKFFLVVSLTIPHGPLDPAHSWNADPRVTPFGFLDKAPNVMPARSTLTERVNARGFKGDENYLWLDDAVGAVLNSLEARGVKDNTAIFVMSDHGMAAKGSIYRPGSHTAAYVRYLGRTGQSNALLANIDIQPTILQMMGGTPAGDGVSMMPILENAAAETRNYVYLELGYARSVLTKDYQYIAVRQSDFIRQRAATKGFPLAHWPNHEGLHALEKWVLPSFPNYLAADQLYAVGSDPNEKVNLFGQPAYLTMASQLRAITQLEASKTPGNFKVD